MDVTMLASITRILENAHEPDSSIRPTELYNEGWMLRIVLDWFAANSLNYSKLDHPLAFHPGATWYSESLLPTHFKRRKMSGDTLAESRTHADGVIGQCRMEENTKAGFQLIEEATQFIVVEAKMKSSLSAGTTHIKYWDQASRNIACMAEAIAQVDAKDNSGGKNRNVNKLLSSLDHIGFYVTAPEEQIPKHNFQALLSEESIKDKVKRRVSEYGGESALEAGHWHQEFFLPLMERIIIEAVSWESIIEFIRDLDPVGGEQISRFYDYCLKFN